jgi:hypothetical protein
VSGPIPDRELAPRWSGVTAETLKECTRCHRSLPVLAGFDWYTDNRYGTQRPRPECVPCRNERSREVYARKKAREVPCRVDDCKGFAFCLGLCPKHYRRQQKEGYGPCQIEGCDKLQQDGGLCSMHRRRLHKFGDVGPPGPARRAREILVDYGQIAEIATQSTASRPSAVSSTPAPSCRGWRWRAAARPG